MERAFRSIFIFPYFFLAINNIYEYTIFVFIYRDGSIFETSNVDITLRTLAAPTSFTAKAARKKVSIAFKKATGAKKCEIYRSTKKTSGFKKIATITATKYTDKRYAKANDTFTK